MKTFIILVFAIFILIKPAFSQVFDTPKDCSIDIYKIENDTIFIYSYPECSNDIERNIKEKDGVWIVISKLDSTTIFFTGEVRNGKNTNFSKVTYSDGGYKITEYDTNGYPIIVEIVHYNFEEIIKCEQTHYYRNKWRPGIAKTTIKEFDSKNILRRVYYGEYFQAYYILYFDDLGNVVEERCCFEAEYL